MKVEFSMDKAEEGKEGENEELVNIESPRFRWQFSPDFTIEPSETKNDDKIKKYVENMKVWKRLTIKEREEKQELRDERIKKALRNKRIMVKENIK